MKDAIHVMIDFETLSVGTLPALLQLGVGLFNINTGAISLTHMDYIDPLSCWKHGADFNGETFEWWMSQKEEIVSSVLGSAFKKGGGVFEVLNQLSSALEILKRDKVGKEVYFWSNGANADIQWLIEWFKVLNIKNPINFWEIRDVRTITALAYDKGVDVKAVTPKPENQHDAVADVEWQIKYVSEAYKVLMGDIK